MADVDEVTVVVVMVNVPVVLPAATVTEAATVADALLLDNATETPPVGAAPLNVTLPVVEVPPLTLEGLIEIEERATEAAGVIASAAVLLTLP